MRKFHALLMALKLAAVLEVAAPQTHAQIQIHTWNGPADKPFGYDAASVDWDADGVRDAVIPIELFDNYAVHVYSGHSGKQLAKLDGVGPDHPFWTTASVSSAGDFNGDGREDVVVGLPEQEDMLGDIFAQVVVFSGATGAQLAHLNIQFAPKTGRDVALLGDVNGDGRDELVVSAGSSLNVLVAPTAATFYTVTGASSSDSFGWGVAGLGDINLDGFPDVLAGAPGTNTNTGAAHILSGPTGTLIRTITIPGTTHFGHDVASAGDANGDGYSDLLIASGGTAPKAFLVSGRSGFTLAIAPGFPPLGTSPAGHVAGVGDVDGDGLRDFAVGDGAALYVYSGPSGVLLGAFSGAVPGDGFGRGVAGMGDVNGDGLDDFVAIRSGVEGVGATDFGYARVLSLTPGAKQLRVGTPGCVGPHLLFPTAIPHVGNTAFGVATTLTSPGSLGLGLIADVANPSGANPLGLGIQLYVDLFASGFLVIFDIPSDSDGHASASLPIPPDPQLAGTTYHLTTVWLWPASTCVPTTSGLSTSNLLSITILP